MTRRARLLLALLVVALALLTVAGWDRAQVLTGWGLPKRAEAPMLIVAHRGNTGAFPEDTAEAIWDAARLKPDGIEFDVHQSAHGTWWVIHDASVDRTTNGSGLVSRMTDEELGRLVVEAGRGFDPTRHVGLGVPTLATVLDGLSDYDGELFLDLQHAVDADPTDLVAASAGFDVTVICRTAEDVTAVKSADRAVRTLLRIDRITTTDGLDAIFLEAGTEATVGRVQEQELPVVTYMDDRYAYLGQEAILRRAWAVGVDEFLASDLEGALRQREVLVAQASQK